MSPCRSILEFRAAVPGFEARPTHTLCQLLVLGLLQFRKAWQKHLKKVAIILVYIVISTIIAIVNISDKAAVPMTIMKVWDLRLVWWAVSVAEVQARSLYRDPAKKTIQVLGSYMNILDSGPILRDHRMYFGLVGYGRSSERFQLADLPAPHSGREAFHGHVRAQAGEWLVTY